MLQLFVTITFQILWTSEVRHGLCNHQHVDCSFNKLNLSNGLLWLIAKKTPKRRITCSLWGESIQSGSASDVAKFPMLSLQWRHNERDGVLNHQRFHCLLNHLFGRRSKKTSNSASLAFVWGIHRDRWIPRTKGQLRGKSFHLMTSSWWLLYGVVCGCNDRITYFTLNRPLFLTGCTVNVWTYVDEYKERQLLFIKFDNFYL